MEICDFRGGGIEDVDEEIREDGFFECGFEGLDEAVGEVADESDGIGDEEGLAVGELDAAGGGIECGEEHVLGEDVGSREAVEEGGFTGVGVADDRAMGGIEFLAFLALGFALFADDFEFAFAAVYAEVGEAAIDFDLFFAHAAFGSATAACAAAAGAAFTIQVAPHSGESGEGVLHACELYLQACFPGAGAFGKDVENDFLAVDDAEVCEFFPFTLLGGCEVVIEDDDIALVGFGEGDDFSGLAGAAEEFPVHLAGACEDGIDDVDVEGFYEVAKFGEEGGGFVFFVFIEVEAHCEGALDHFGF